MVVRSVKVSADFGVPKQFILNFLKLDRFVQPLLLSGRPMNSHQPVDETSVINDVTI